MKVALVNVKYSPNLGDGLIAECLEWALGECLPNAEFVSVDLAGRTAYDPDSGSGRSRALAALAHLPKPARRLAVATLLRALIEMRYKATWTSLLDGCDRLVLGGGQLLADADLNFPLKIRSVAALAGARKLPSAVFGVGVSKDWSAAGTRLFRSAMDDLKPDYVAVRDEASAANWATHFNCAAHPAARLCRDPGLLAASVYPAPPRPARPRPFIGLGVVHPLTLNLHTHGAPLSLTAALGAWKSIVSALHARGADVALFTNGPSDDEAFLESILEAAAAAAPGRTLRLPKPRRPADLVTNIAGCDAIAAHRLHANIVAFACKVPHVGLGWDAKLPAFFASAGRSVYVTEDIRSVPPEEIASRVLKSIEDPVPAEVYESMIAETWTGIRDCAAALVRATAPGSAPA